MATDINSESYIKYLIELYLRYSNNPREYGKTYKRSFTELLKEIELAISILPLKELIKIYLFYSKPNKLKDNYMNNLLILIYEAIENRLKNFKTIDLIDNYAELFDSILTLSDSIQSYQNIINVRTYNLNDDYYVESQAMKSRKSVEEFKQDYQREIDSFQDILNSSNSSYNYLNKLEESINNYLNNLICNLNKEENNELIMELNKRIEIYSQKLIYQKKILTNKKALEIEMRLNNINASNIQDKFSYDNLKNKLIIYEDYQSKLISKSKKSGI